MKIDNIEIKAFGKLNNRQIQLSEGINVFYGNNEAGKSTLQEFIKAMFFSPRTLRTSDYLKKFEPWNVDSFGGNLSYTLGNGMTYRVEKDFKNQTINFYDRFFNEISSQFEITREGGAQFAKAHMGVGEETFEKTVFIRQMETRLNTGARKTLFESVINYAQTGIKGLAVEDILLELNKALKTYVGNNRTKLRPLEQISRELEELVALRCKLLAEREEIMGTILKKSDGSLLDKLNVLKRLTKKGFEFAVQQKEIERLKEKIKMSEDYYKSLLKTEEQNIRIKEAQENIARNKQEQYKSLNTDLEEKLKLLNELELKLEINRLFKKKAEEYEVEIEAYLAKESSLQGQGEDKGVLLSNLDVIIPTGVAIALYFIFESVFYSQVMSWASLIFSVIYPILRMIIKNKTGFADNQKSGYLFEIFEKLGVRDSNDYRGRLEEYDFQISEFEHLSEEICGLEEKIECLENSSNTGFVSEQVNLNTILDTKKEIDALKRALLISEIGFENKMSAFVEELKKEGLQEPLLEEIKSEGYYLNSLDEIDERIKDAISINKDVQILSQRIEEIDEELLRIDEKIEGKEKTKTKYEDISFALNTAIVSLQEVGEEIKRGILPKMIKDFADGVSILTKGNYRQVNIDDKHDIKIVEENVQKIIDAGMLSGGTVEQIYFALRVALANSLFANDEKLPLILDETFAYYDDERTKIAFDFLKELSKEHQILIFTCKSREVEIASEVFGSEMKYFELAVES